MTAEEHLARAAEYRRRADDRRPGDYLSMILDLCAADHEKAAAVSGRDDYSKIEAMAG